VQKDCGQNTAGTCRPLSCALQRRPPPCWCWRAANLTRRTEAIDEKTATTVQRKKKRDATLSRNYASGPLQRSRRMKKSGIGRGRKRSNTIPECYGRRCSDGGQEGDTGSPAKKNCLVGATVGTRSSERRCQPYGRQSAGPTEKGGESLVTSKKPVSRRGSKSMRNWLAGPRGSHNLRRKRSRTPVSANEGSPDGR